jgi:hypothetical protein
MERVMKSMAALSITALIVIALSTCVNPFDWVAKVSDEVMQAKDLYLEIDSTTPTANKESVDPWGTIDIQFDRDIDLTTVSDATILLSPAVGWTRSYNPLTFKLSIKPTALDSKAGYTVTVTRDVKGMDGSSLRDPLSWSFTTADAPGGSISINGVVNGVTKYTNSLSAKVTIYYNARVTKFRVATDPLSYGLTYTMVDGSSPDEADVTLAGSLTNAATKKIYVQFYDVPQSIETPGDVMSDSIVIDVEGPVISTLGTVPTYLNKYGWASSAAVTDAGSGIGTAADTYAWSKVSGATAAFTPNNTLNTVVTATTEGALTFRLSVKDRLGNVGTRNASVTVDITSPSPPASVAASENPTSDTSPLFTWTTGGGGGGYRYKWTQDSDSYWAYTTATSGSASTISLSEYGNNTLEVQESDAAGNWSTSKTGSTFIFPKYLSPEHGSKDQDMSPFVQWAENYNERLSYMVYARYGENDYEPLLKEATTSISMTIPSSKPLLAKTTYDWFFFVYDGHRTTRVPAGTQAFSFTTGTRNFP